MKFNEVASGVSKGVESLSNIFAADASAVKPGVVAGLRQSLGTSFGNDAKPGIAFDM